MKLIKAHAYGNDFLLHEGRLGSHADWAATGRAVCERHRGLGGDGLIVFAFGTTGNDVAMRLINADGSPSEVSGNGVRCLAAWVASSRRLEPGAAIGIRTDAGVKRLTLLKKDDAASFTFRAAMGQPEQIDRVQLDAGGERVEAVTMRVGNPQCVVLGGELTRERLHTVAAALSTHHHFPEGTNVELATVESPERVRILIWERGVGPTEASGTGACGAAVAAMQFGGASRAVDVVAPGGTQRVEWLDDGLYLTGAASLIAQVETFDREPQWS
jgi:diaminopimelate epimerase